jgi:nicotinate dehydrogenase subunit B
MKKPSSGTDIALRAISTSGTDASARVISTGGTDTPVHAVSGGGTDTLVCAIPENASNMRKDISGTKHSGFSRRDFLKQSGALIVSFSVLGAAAKPVLAQFTTGGTPGSPAPDQLDSWIAINSDGTITGYTGKSELGQGIVTAQTQLVAEELCVPFDRVKMIVCDTDYTPDQGYTSGSQSHPTNFNHENLAQACATAREALVKLASDRLGVPADQLIAADGAVSAKNDPSKKVGYADLIGNKKFNLTVDKNAKRKPASEWTVLGTPVKRPDMAAMVTAQFEYVHNVRRPGMLHGQVVRPPAVGATVVSVDESSVAKMPGVVKVVVKKDFVGIVAEKPYQALQAASELKVNWSSGSGLPNFADFYQHLRTQKPTRDTLLINSKDVDQSLAQPGATIVKATYHHPYQMHGSLGSSCAVADVQNGKATLWSATQGVWYIRSTAAMVLGMKPEDVHVIFTRGSGCYGINGADAVSYDAAILSQAVGKPVRVQLTSAPCSTRKATSSPGTTSPGFPFSATALDAIAPATSSPDCWSASSPRNSRPARLRPSRIATTITATRFPLMLPAMSAEKIRAPEKSNPSAF